MAQDTGFPKPLPVKEASNLKVGDKIDHRNSEGLFCCAKIIKTHGNRLKIHYNAGNKDSSKEEPDVWCDYHKEIDRFARFESISRRPSHRFKEVKRGDDVCVCFKYKYNKLEWTKAEITKLDTESGQFKVCIFYMHSSIKHIGH